MIQLSINQLIFPTTKLIVKCQKPANHNKLIYFLSVYKMSIFNQRLFKTNIESK